MYSGYLIKVKGVGENGSDYIIPLNSIVWGSYKATYSTLDGESKRNGSGRLRRKTYKHRVGHCLFTFRPMSSTALSQIWGEVKSRYVKVRQKKVKASVFIPELNDYIEDYFYVPDIEFNIQKVNNTSVSYSATEVEFIGY